MAKREMAKNIRLRLYQGCVGVVAGLCRVCVGFKGLCRCCFVVVRVVLGLHCVVLALCRAVPWFCQGCARGWVRFKGLCQGCAVVVPSCVAVVPGCAMVLPWFCQGSVRVLLGLFRGFSGFISFQQGQLCLSLMC